MKEMAIERASGRAPARAPLEEEQPAAPPAPGAGGADGAPRLVPDAPWTFLSNHCHVLLVLSQRPSLPLREVALLVGITERSAQRIVGDLEAAGYIERARVGRTNHYALLPGKRLRHPLEAHCSVDELLRLLATGTAGQR